MDKRKYEALCGRGWDAVRVFRAMQGDGVSAIDSIKIIRELFGLSLTEAKEVMLQADGWEGTLDDYQEQVILPVVEAVSHLHAILPAAEGVRPSPDTIDAQRDHLRQVVGWAEKLRGQLGPLLVTQGHRVHFRPTSQGVTMVGLLHDRPQRGHGPFKDLGRLATDFEAIFRQHCEDIPQGRGTSEKELQSHLLREAYQDGRRLRSLRNVGLGDLVFITDEIPMPGDTRMVCDLLALRRDEQGRQIPVVIELKSERALTRLIEQVTGYASLVDLHATLFAQFFAALLGQPVAFTGPCEKVIVWPAVAGGGPEPRRDELAAQGVSVAGYRQEGERFAFTK
jgi:hypothetical protein